MNLVPIYAALPDIEFRVSFGPKFMAALRTTIRLELFRRLNDRKFEYLFIDGHEFEIEYDVENLVSDFISSIKVDVENLDVSQYRNVLYFNIEKYLPGTMSIYDGAIDELMDRIKALAR